MNDIEQPPPGSDEAVALGCKCPVMDNHHGKGAYGGPIACGSTPYWISTVCPLHGAKDDELESSQG